LIAVIDYGAGNIFSVANALTFLGVDNVLLESPRTLGDADAIILPGVGAFPDAMYMLRERGFDSAIKSVASDGKPLLGICLGMQILFEKGYEFRETSGLGLIPGYVDKLTGSAFRGAENPNGLKIPHMGWDEVTEINPCPLSAHVKDGEMMYFVHSYKAVTDSSNVSLMANYGQDVPALVRSGNVFGAQFHPEKSGEPGLQILRDFVEYATNTSS
jgi:glutamine amidotransferase